MQRLFEDVLMRVDLRIVGSLGLMGLLLVVGAGCDQSASNAGVPQQTATADANDPPTPDPPPDPDPDPDPDPPDPTPDPGPPDPDPDPDPAPDPKPMPGPQQDAPDAFEQKLDEVRRLTDEGQTRSALILARMMQQQFADHPKLNELIAIERRLNAQRDLEAELAVPLRNLGSDDPATVRVARQMLRRAGKDAGPLLRRLARQQEKPGSSEALRLLADLGDPAALGMLLDRLDHHADDDLTAALHRLAATAGPETLAPLYEAFADRPDHALAEALIIVLGSHAGGDAAAFNKLAGNDQAYEALRGYVKQRLETGDDPAWALRHAAALGLAQPGLRARFYEGIDLKGKLIADLLVVRPRAHSGELPIDRTQQISARWTGQIRIDTPGRYTFLPTSDDGQRVIINGKMIVEDWNMHAPKERSGTIDLDAGLHDFEVQWMQGGGGFEFTLRWEGPDIKKQEVPAEVFSVLPWEGMEK